MLHAAKIVPTTVTEPRLLEPMAARTLPNMLATADARSMRWKKFFPLKKELVEGEYGIGRFNSSRAR
jgi:hypothetical protein